MSRLVFYIDVNGAYLSWEATRRMANKEPDFRLYELRSKAFMDICRGDVRSVDAIHTTADICKVFLAVSMNSPLN